LRQGTGQRAWLAGWLAAVPLGFAQPAGDVPWARITSPAESRIEAPGVTHVKARADLGGQAIEQIVFADTAEPYVYEWQNRRVGKFVFTVIAQGMNGEAVESPGVEFEVVPKRNAEEAALIIKGSRWRYLDTGEPPDENWIGGAFDRRFTQPPFTSLLKACRAELLSLYTVSNEVC